MTRTVKKLLKKAYKKYGHIEPCRNEKSELKSWNECVLVGDNYITVWCNSDDHSTHMIKT